MARQGAARPRQDIAAACTTNTTTTTITNKETLMKNLSISAVALAIGLAFSAGSMAQVQPKEVPADSKTMTKEVPADVRKDAATEKRDADYKVAKEKCDAFAGDAKASCMTDAKTRYGKS